MTAADVLYTFNLLKSNPKLYTSGAPIVTSATAPSATSAVLNFAEPEYANLFLIGQVYIVPQHVWSTIANPVSYADANPVGTGAFTVNPDDVAAVQNDRLGNVCDGTSQNQ